MSKLALAVAIALTTAPAYAETVSISANVGDQLALPQQYDGRKFSAITINVDGQLTTTTTLTAGTQHFGGFLGSSLTIHSVFGSDDYRSEDMANLFAGETQTYTSVLPFRSVFTWMAGTLYGNDLWLDFTVYPLDYEPGNGGDNVVDASINDVLSGTVTATIDLVPEPAAFALFGLGIGALALTRARRF